MTDIQIQPTEYEIPPILKQFYIEIHEWIKSGCKANEVFKERWGLCANFANYANFRCTKYLITDHLASAGLDVCYPFDGCTVNYTTSGFNNKLYKNKKRLAWIEKHATSTSI